MRTVTLEPETIITTNVTKSKNKSKNKSAPVVTTSINDLIDDQSYIFSMQTNDVNRTSDFGEWKTVKSKGNKLVKKSLSESSDIIGEVTIKPETQTNATNTNKKTTLPSNLTINECGQPITTDPVKRLRNLRKKLKEIESLKQKDHAILEKEQLEKIKREEEITQQIILLASQIEDL